MGWRRAFLEQAESDFVVFKRLNRNGFHVCHRLHYLQMSTEKLSKSLLSVRAQPPHKKTHSVLVRFLRLSKGRPEIRRGLGFGADFAAYKSYVDSLLDIAERIEKLAPVGNDFERPNAEYPWQSRSDGVQAPCSYGFPEFKKTDMIKFQGLVSNLLRVARSLL